MLSPIALLTLGVVVGLVGARFARNAKPRTLLVAFLAVVPVVAIAVTPPFRFANGLATDAGEVNANFDALAGAINAVPVVTSVDGLSGGTVGGDVNVDGVLSVNALRISNVNITALGDGILLEHPSGHEITVDTSGITLTAGTSRVALTAGGVTVFASGLLSVDSGGNTAVGAAAILDLNGSLITIN